MSAHARLRRLGLAVVPVVGRLWDRWCRGGYDRQRAPIMEGLESRQMLDGTVYEPSLLEEQPQPDSLLAATTTVQTEAPVAWRGSGQVDRKSVV